MSKGPDWERNISKRLSLWWTEDDRDDIFWRTSGSGARATVRAKKGIKTKYQYGDLTFTDPVGKPLIDYFLIELKRGYPDLGVLLLIDGKQKVPVLVKWWKKAEKERQFGERKAAILIIKRDFKHPIIVFACDVFSRIESFCGEWEGNIVSVYLTAIEEKLIIVPLYPFLKYCSAENMRLFMESEI